MFVSCVMNNGGHTEFSYNMVFPGFFESINCKGNMFVCAATFVYKNCGMSS